MSNSSDVANPSESPKKILLLAGAGDFPVIIAHELSSKGHEISVIAFKNETSAIIEKFSKDVSWIELGSLSEIFRIITEKNIKDLILAGKIDHKYLFQKKLDDSAIEFFRTLPDTRAESILYGLINELKKIGVAVISSCAGLEHLFAGSGILNDVGLLHGEINDIGLGFKVAKGLSSFDIGQSVAVKKGTVVAVEAIEGTDELIARAYKLSGDGNIIIKVARPKQDMRFDVPVIGEKTIELLASNRARVIAVEAEKTLIFNKQKVLDLASVKNITVYGYKDE